jgi:hypothetical protein
MPLFVVRQFVHAVTSKGSREPTAQEAAKLATLAGLVSVCIGIMHSWCMPATKSSLRPHDAKHEYNTVRKDMRDHHSRWAMCKWAAPVLLSKCVPSNAYICSRLLSRRAAECDPAETAFWQVRLFNQYSRCIQAADMKLAAYVGISFLIFFFGHVQLLRPLAGMCACQI